MIVKCFGARGSIPVSGAEFDEIGGNTTCVEVISDNDRIIIDAGSGIIKIGDNYCNEKIKNINLFITHYHFDHIIGLPFFRPMFNSDYKINIFGPSYKGKKVEDIIKNIIFPPAFPVDFKRLLKNKRFTFKTLEPGEEFNIGEIKIETISLSHPNGGLGYKFINNNKKFVFLTDNELDFKHKSGCSFKEYCDFSKNADLLIHDSEFLEKEYKASKSWGHSLFTSALDLAHCSKVKHFGLFHHNKCRSDSDVTKMIQDSIDYMNKNNMNFQISAISQNFEFEI
ncbi:MAG: MBL fold metallo-hydrolase [Candidatus Muirbacterium halophilum]|jgi:phosphoribosyl 1,2-cyclic phosphodiesterase|nr:MBL fold metallo-hydrolase [Candidatus Muirbacterium halophilum]MCK9476085.1 MBL fold metallo-hydrolase [Candidatus Muirbacterium halophilum]